MAHLTIVTKRSSMTQWPIQRNIYTLVSQTNSMNKSNQQESTNILTTHNINTPRLSSTNNHHTSQQQQQQQQSSTFNTFDDSLTNLSWLHDINILKRTMPPINSSSSTTNNKRKEQPSPCSSSSNRDSIYPNDISDNNDLTINNDDDDDDQWRMYKTNPQAKPVYSYSQLILFALKQSGHDKMTLQMIYDWVAENFPYFKKMEPTWQNSIRHNLSLNKWFIKVPRTKKEAGGGKGGFWKLSPDYERQRSLIHIQQQQQQQQMNSTHNKRSRHSKRSTPLSLNQIISNNVTPLTKNSSRISYENIKTEPWIDPILPCIGLKNQSPLHCHTTIIDRSYVRMPSSFLSPTSSPDSLTISPFNNQQINDLSSILTPSPSSSPSSMSSVISKQNLNGTKLDDTDMLLLDSSTFDWDAYLCETTNDIDVQPLLSSRTEHDLFNDFNAALSDLTSSAEAAAAAGADTNNAFDAFDYTSKHSTFNCLFEDDDQSQQQQQIIESSNNSADLTIKGCGIKRPSWWIINEGITSTKLPSLETAFDLKLSK